MGEASFGQNNKADTRNLSIVPKEKGPEATSPLKKNLMNNRKAGVQTQVYRRARLGQLIGWVFCLRG
jgi:hypothetical protein